MKQLIFGTLMLLGFAASAQTNAQLIKNNGNRSIDPAIKKALGTKEEMMSKGGDVKAGNVELQTFTGDPLHTRKYTLPNGLQIWITVNKNEPR